MGTNFYQGGFRHNSNPKHHIGKRSAAGLYCWDCGVTLCKDGEAAVHNSSAEWYDKCPICGKEPSEDAPNAVLRELGFFKGTPRKKTGVASCSSFTWARKLGRIENIIDEYGGIYTRKTFLGMLEECPIQYERYGVWFS